MENNILNATNEQIELVEDKNATLQVRTKESLRDTFKSIDGATDNDKLIKLLDLYKKFQATQDKFSIDTNLDVIDKAFNTLKSQLGAIATSVNQYERTMNEKYVVGVADEMKLLKEQIESEEVLNAKIINLEKDLELLQKRYEEQEKIMLSSKEKIEGLEVDNKNYIALNSQLVSKENDYINQKKKKDSVINSKDVEINKLVNDYESKLKSLEEQYKAKIEQLEKDNKATVKDFESKLIESDKEKAVLESKIESLTNNVTSLNTENKELKANIELVRKEAKEDIKTLEKEHKIEIKALEKEVANAKETNNKIALEKAKLESKIENLENNINALNETKKNLETEIKACSDSLKNKDIEISNKEKEIEKINGALADAKVELEKMVKENKKIQTNLDKVNKENKDLKAEINKFEKGVK